MADDQIAVVADLVDGIRDLGLAPVLVGGMALVILGSRRVTDDYDFVVSRPGDQLERIVDLFYDRGFELASRVNDAGDVTATIDNRRVACARLRIDEPASAYFFNVATRLRVDLLFDFPLPAAALAERATRLTIRAHVFEIASPADLLHLKELARSARSVAGDAQDLEFLRSYLAGKGGS